MEPVFEREAAVRTPMGAAHMVGNSACCEDTNRVA